MCDVVWCGEVCMVWYGVVRSGVVWCSKGVGAMMVSDDDDDDNDNDNDDGEVMTMTTMMMLLLLLLTGVKFPWQPTDRFTVFADCIFITLHRSPGIFYQYMTAERR